MIENYLDRDINNKPLNPFANNENPENHESLKNNNHEIHKSETKESDTENSINNLSKAFKNNINFNISGTIDQGISDRLRELYNGNESLSGILANNEQIKLLLSDLFSEYSKYIEGDKKRLKNQIDQGNPLGEQVGVATDYYNYLLENDSEEGFLNFLVSSKCIDDVLYPYLSMHTDNRGRINFISKNDIKAKIKAAYNKKLFEDFSVDMNGATVAEIQHLNNMGSFVKNKVDNVIYEYLSKNNKNVWKDAEFLNTLTELYNKVEANNKKTKDYKYSRDQVFYMLRTSIKEYSRLLDLSDENRKLRRTGGNNADEIFDIQLRSYLFLYGKLFYGKDFETKGGGLDTYEGKLGEILDAILANDGHLHKTRDVNKYDLLEQNMREAWLKRDDKMEKRRLRPMPNKPGDEPPDIENEVGIDTNNFDVQEASGVEIAQELGLGDELEIFNIEENLLDSREFRGEIIFKKTCDDFMMSEEGKIFAKLRVRMSVLLKPNPQNSELTLNPGAWIGILRRLKNKNAIDMLKIKSDFDKLRNGLIQFKNKYNENWKDINDNMDNNKEIAQKTIKNHAIGAVIDNIKDMFQNIIVNSNDGSYLSGFEFNENSAAKIDNNNLIISGKFNGEPLIIKYNLETGELFMNAYISENMDGSITVGDSSPNQKIGELKPFQNILYDFCKKPTYSMSNNLFPNTKRFPRPLGKPEQNEKDEKKGPRSGLYMRRRQRENMRRKTREENKNKFREMLGTEIDKVGKNVENYADSMITKSGTVAKLMRTLNLMPSSDLDAKKNIKPGSDLHKTILLIKNSSNDDLNTFSELMDYIAPYLGIKWGENNMSLNKESNEYKTIFGSNNSESFGEKQAGDGSDEDMGEYLRHETQNFENELSINNNLGEIDSNYKSGLLSIISKNFTDNSAAPNRKLDKNKMSTFRDKFEAHIDLEKFVKVDIG